MRNPNKYILRSRNFNGSNIILSDSKNVLEKVHGLYLPANGTGVVATSWKGGLFSRLTYLFRGRIWVSTMTFDQPMQPLFLSAKRKDLFTLAEDRLTPWQRFRNRFKKKDKIEPKMLVPKELLSDVSLN